MDGNRFDDITRALAGGTSRRRAIKGLLGGITAGVAALAGRGAADAQRLPNGSACTRATQCASLKCADGVCCNAQCAGQCEGCNLAGSVGTCVPLPAGTQQHGSRPACTGTDVCQASCDGTTRNQCTQYPGLDIPCAEGTCEDGFGITYGCGGDGTCHPLSESCGLYVCNAGGTACLTTCASDRDCVGEAFCLNGSCVEDRPLGGPCTADAQCASGICVNGVCCVERCGVCEVCNAPGNAGFCGPGPDGISCGLDDICCEGDCIDVQIDVEHCGVCHNSCVAIPNSRAVCIQSRCDIACLPGFQRCDFPTLICIPESGCCGDTECPGTQFCDLSTHTCAPDRPVGGSCTRNCGPLPPAECSTDAMCLSGICLETTGTCGCATDADCPANQFCDAGTNRCTPDLPLGAPCNRAAQCLAGVCNAPGPSCGCGTLRLSGSATDPNAPIGIDNYLDLFINGVFQFRANPNPGAGFVTGPFNINAAPGALLRIVGWDFGGIEQFGPAWLHCLATGAVQAFDAVGHPSQLSDPAANPNNHVVFYDRTITVQL